MKYVFALTFFLFTIKGFCQSDSTTTFPDTVKVGSYVISLHDVNFHEKEYTIRFWLWFVYDNPDFDFTRQLDIPNAKEIAPPEVILDSLDGKAWAIMKMKCKMKQNWEVHDFPFDSQHLRVQIENTLFDNTQLVFLPDTAGSRFDHKEAIDGWRVDNFTVTQHDNDYETGFGDNSSPYQVFSSFNIEMDIERNAWGLFLKIFIGMYIAFAISVLSFTPHPSELEPRFGLPVGGLFAAVGNKYIIDSLLPETTSFTLVDTLHALTFFAIFSTLMISAVSLKLHDNNKSEKALRISRRGSRIVIVTYAILNVIAILMAWI
jgi:hypothetical protein